MTLESLEGRLLLSADPIAQAVTAPLAVHAGSAIAGAPLDSSGDTDGSGTLSGSISGNVGSGVLFNGTIGGGLSGTFSGKSLPGNGNFYGSGSLSDGSTFTGSGNITIQVSGNTFTGTFGCSGDSSNGDDDLVVINGTMSGTIDSSGNASGSFTGTISVNEQPLNNDALIWNPQGGSTNGSDAANWYDDTRGMQDVVAPTAGNAVIFDGTPTSQTPYDASPIDWTESVTVANMVLENGYAAQQTIAAGVTLTLPAYDDTNNAGGTFYVNFLAADSVLDLDSRVAQVITPGNWDVGAGGRVVIDKSVDQIAGYNFGIGANLKQSCGSPIDVKNGELIFGDGKNSGQYSTFSLTNAAANISISPGSSITFYQTATTLINATIAAAPVISNSGTANLIGVQGGVVGTAIAVPLQNHGTLNANGGIFSFQATDNNNNNLSMDAGSINMFEGATIQATDNNNNNLSMDAGSINMFEGATISCTNQFTQTGGAFNIMGAQASFQVAAGDANFNGGTVNFTNPAGYGTLTSFSIVFNGATLNMRIKASSSDSDRITVPGGGTVTIKGNSTIDVTMNGSETEVISWTLISSNNAITGDFRTVNLPTFVFEDAVINVWSCHYSH